MKEISMRRALRRVMCVMAAGAACLMPGAAAAQNARDGRVQVTVVDPSGLVVPEAVVTIVGLEAATQTLTLPDVRTTDKGIAIIERVPPGRYSVRAEFPGFDLGLLRDIRVRAGDNRHVVVLPLQKLEDAVTVSRDAQAAAADRRSSEFGVNLAPDQIQALSDDPNELARQLAELAGPDAIIRIDSFEGQQLPPKAQIKSIHVTRDQFAAEAAQPGSTFVDVVTQPGIGPLRGTTTFSLRDGSMSGRSQFTPTRGPEQFRDFGGNLGGTLVQNKTSFSASLNGQNSYVSPILNAALPGGVRAETLDVRQPLAQAMFNGMVDHAITRDQTLRISTMIRRFRRENQGIGNYNLPERGFSQEQHENSIRIQEAGPLGRRSFMNTRFSYTFGDIDMRSNVEAPTIVVQDAFTSGGSQQKQRADLRFLSLASDVDHVRGIHSFRGGFQLDGNWFQASSSFNYLGTYTFASLDAFERGAPILYTRSLGTPEVSYRNLQGAAYFQDDVRVRRGLTFSPGVRYTRQQRVKDSAAFEPRFGLTWAPFATGRTTLRGSAGVFHSWLPLQLVEQTLRLNGELQREIIIQNPSYPDPGEETVRALPTSKYLIGDGFKLGRNVRYSAGVDQVLSPRLRTNVLYNYIHLQQQPRGRNLNAPVNGVRPDPTFANVIESITDTEIRRHEIYVNAIISLAAQSPALNQALFNWRRININAGYTWIRARNNAVGPFDVSPSGNPENDWGPGPQDQPYRVQILMTSTQIRNVTANLTYLANSGAPYNWTTGFDDNLDGLLNDRPDGVGLRSLRGADQQTLNARVQYAFALANPQGLPVGQARYRMNIFANINNVTNHQNLGGYSGVATSPNFQKPTFAMNPRNVNLGVGFNF
jgi:hypothetical protein